MSADSGNNRSRHSNGSYPASTDTGPKPPDSENDDYPDERPDVPTVEERIDGLLDDRPERCMVPVSSTHGTKLRSEAFEEPETVGETVEVGDHDELVVEHVAERTALPHIALVEEFLEWYERYRDMYLKMEKRGRRDDPEQFLIGLDNSYSAEYQSKHYARLSAWERQILGGEYPHGEEIDGAFEEPVTALMGLTASAYCTPGEPESGIRPVCDHDREIRDAWVGSSNSVKRTLRYVLEDKLGLGKDDYTWWLQSEPHGGDGINSDRSHSHPVVVLDAAAADVSADAISAETFRPVVAKHVAECDGATWDAHEVEETVTVHQPDDINSLSGYVAKYVACDPEKDLLERSDDYIMWAASQWATATQKYSRDRVATAATKADACHQEYVSSESNQEHDHGEVVVRSAAGASTTFECVECGSGFGIDQDCTLTEHRTAQTAADGVCAADGGEVVEESGDGDTTSLRSRWRDAQTAGVVEEPVRSRTRCLVEWLESEPQQTTAGFRRPPTWEPVSVVKRWTDDESALGAPGGVEYDELVVEGAGSIESKLPDRYLLGDEPAPGGVRLPQPEWLEGPEPWERHPVDESDVRDGTLPPPELVSREHAEHAHNRRITRKEWVDDWYARRFEHDGADGDDVRDGLDESQRAAVIQLVESESVSSAAEVVGKLQLPPSAVEEVRVLL